MIELPVAAWQNNHGSGADLADQKAVRGMLGLCATVAKRSSAGVDSGVRSLNICKS